MEIKDRDHAEGYIREHELDIVNVHVEDFNNKACEMEFRVIQVMMEIGGISLWKPDLGQMSDIIEDLPDDDLIIIANAIQDGKIYDVIDEEWR